LGFSWLDPLASLSSLLLLGCLGGLAEVIKPVGLHSGQLGGIGLLACWFWNMQVPLNEWTNTDTIQYHL